MKKKKREEGKKNWQNKLFGKLAPKTNKKKITEPKGNVSLHFAYWQRSFKKKESNFWKKNKTPIGL